MAELIAEGAETSQSLRLEISEGQVVRLGRSPQAEPGQSAWAIPWDRLISRNHADLVCQEGGLQIRRLPRSRNPIYVDEIEQEYQFTLPAGGLFRIGSTLFRFEVPKDTFSDEASQPPAEIDPTSLTERVYSMEELQQTEFGNAVDRMEVFANLPKLLAESRTDAEFAKQLVALLLPTIPLAQAAAVIRSTSLTKKGEAEFDLVRSVLRDGKGDFHPSRRLVRAALREGTSRVQQWAQMSGGPISLDAFDEEATNSLNLEWAICAPVPDRRQREWCLYVTGKFSMNGRAIVHLDDLKPDVRYIELLAQFVGAARQVRLLQQQQGVLGHFFSPNIMEWLNESHDPHVLSPRQCDITALVCDLRGFSRRAEQAQNKLPQLLSHVSGALDLMTRSIFHYDGVVGDYQGDSALGFWGWPFDSPGGPLPACRTALLIQEEFRRARQDADGPLADLRIGIGIAHGPGLAGKIGTEDHAKVGAFGPVVQRAARLESLTKTLRASIILDEAAAGAVREHLSPDEGRSRRLGRVRLPGLESPAVISELLPPVDQDSSLTDEHIEEYEAAVDDVTEGRWEEALKHLAQLPPGDRAKDFLMIFIAQNDYEPPPNWDGVLTLPGF